MNTNEQTNPATGRAEYTTVRDHDHLPRITVTEELVDQAHDETFGTDDKPKVVSILDYCESPWSHLFDEFHRQRIVHVMANQTLLLRYEYDYEVDLDRIHDERDLLAWTDHLCGKTWMNTERVSHFIAAVASIKGFNLNSF